ncbi:MAG: hypothetical protein KDD89_07245 [Anaerolineales bacterium]|nr:hypothetical protein [Anaerolineales bacterium]
MNEVTNTATDMIESNDNWATKWLLGGVILGAVLGLITAYMMVRNARESRGGPPEISVGEGVGATIAVLGVVRTIAGLGD